MAKVFGSDQQRYARLLISLGAHLGIPSCAEAFKLLENEVAPRRIALLYPFDLGEWKSAHWFRLKRNCVEPVLSHLRRPQSALALLLPEDHRQAVGQLLREYEAELSRLDSIRRAHSMNVSASEDWEDARCQLLIAAYLLNVLSQPFAKDSLRSQEKLVLALPGWEAAISSTLKAIERG